MSNLPNKFKATWCSSSSIASFLKCKRAYFLQNVYKDKDKEKVSVVSPYMSLGTVIHNVLEPLAEIPSEERAVKMLAPSFYAEWAKCSGEKGGFKTPEQENEFKEQGKTILKNVKENIHHLLGETAFLIPGSKELPFMWISEEENIILCGAIDMIFKPKENSYRVLDFKTGQREESETSLQLPIYSILLNHFLGESEFSGQYWYVARSKDPIDKIIPTLEESKKTVLDIGLEMKETRARGIFECEHGGCWNCRDLERVINGEGKFVGKGRFSSKLYMLD